MEKGKAIKGEYGKLEVRMEKLLTFGIDIGSNEHHLAIFTPEGTWEKEIVVPHNYRGFKMALDELKGVEEKFGMRILGGLEGYHGYGSPFDMYLLDHGIQLKQVNSFKLDKYRELFGQPFKKDSHDAKLIASFVANHKLLKIGERRCLHDIIRENKIAQNLRALSRYQETLVREQTRCKNRIRKHIKEYFPEYLDIISKNGLCAYKSLSLLIECFHLGRLKEMGAKEISNLRAPGSKARVGTPFATKIKRAVESIDYFPPTMEAICEVISREAKRLLELKQEISELDKKLENMGRNFKPFRIIKSYTGAGTRESARLAGEIVSVERFHSADAFALYIGTAGNDDSSGKTKRVKTARKINYRAKNAIMLIAFCSIRFNPKSRAYYARRRGEGMTHWEAVKRLARHLARIFYAMLKNGMEYDPEYKSPGPREKMEKKYGQGGNLTLRTQASFVRQKGHTLPKMDCTKRRHLCQENYDLSEKG